MMNPPLSLAAAAAIGMLSAPAGAQGANPGDDQAVAAMIEWTVANCGMDGMSPMHVMMAQMIANGTDPAEMDRVREMVRDRIGGQFETTEAACADLKSHFLGG
jgi:hypothetical protein